MHKTLCSNHLHKLAILWAFNLELNHTVGSSKQCVVAAEPNIFSSVKMGATLTNNNVPRYRLLTAIEFDTQAFAFGIATISGTTTCFFMSHNFLPSLPVSH